MEQILCLHLKLLFLLDREQTQRTGLQQFISVSSEVKATHLPAETLLRRSKKLLSMTLSQRPLNIFFLLEAPED